MVVDDCLLSTTLQWIITQLQGSACFESLCKQAPPAWAWAWQRGTSACRVWIGGWGCNQGVTAFLSIQFKWLSNVFVICIPLVEMVGRHGDLWVTCQHRHHMEHCWPMLHLLLDTHDGNFKDSPHFAFFVLVYLKFAVKKTQEIVFPV